MRDGPEARLQRAVTAFLAVALPDDAAYLVFPGGDGRRTHPGTGYRAGTPDLAVVHQGRVQFIELKSPTGTVSAKQGDMIQRLGQAGCATHVCRSVEAVEEALRLNGVPLRATMMPGRYMAATLAARSAA